MRCLRKGIPDEAYKPLTGDDKETAKIYAKHNKQQRDGKGATGFLADLRPPATSLMQHALAICRKTRWRKSAPSEMRLSSCMPAQIGSI